MGFGDVGQALARRARGIGMRVIAMRRSPRGTPVAHAPLSDLALDPLADLDREDPSALADEILRPDRLDDLLRDADVVVNAAPLTPATVRLFGREQFARMRPAACFINLGRGETVDQDALIDSLRDGVIAAAGLDVTTPEPLPPDSLLWTLPNVILTAHYAGWSDTMLDRIYAIFTDNLRNDSTAASPSAIGWTCARGIDQSPSAVRPLCETGGVPGTQLHGSRRTSLPSARVICQPALIGSMSLQCSIFAVRRHLPSRT